MAMISTEEDQFCRCQIQSTTRQPRTGDNLTVNNRTKTSNPSMTQGLQAVMILPFPSQYYHRITEVSAVSEPLSVPEVCPVNQVRRETQVEMAYRDNRVPRDLRDTFS
uniref:(northern house mosquito) hypothetical protein n=1 Tax=Culex pipiens TaxID=7175 RepID=A0A8D8FBR9_CULPI